MAYQPTVSIIIIFLNAERFIHEAINSVFSQTYQKWELLLVDDGSTDTSSAIARGFAEKYPEKVRYLEHEGHQNRDMPASRNLGIRASKGEYIAFLDADDVWLQNKLERQVSILASNPEAVLVYGLDQHWYSWAGDPGNSQPDFVDSLRVPPNVLIRPPLLFKLFLQRQAYIPCPTGILARRVAFECVGGFEETFRGMYNIYEDQAFYAKLCLELPVIAIDECWDRYRQHPDSSCAIAQRMGHKKAARDFFLNWVDGYLRKRKISDPQVWMVLRIELWKLHYPNLYRYLDVLRQRMHRIAVPLLSKKY